jgi:hypothetical protein
MPQPSARAHPAPGSLPTILLPATETVHHRGHQEHSPERPRPAEEILFGKASRERV